MWLRIASEYPIQHISQPLVLKRQREGSLGADIEKKARSLLYVTDKIADLYPELDSLRRKRKAKVYGGLSRNRAVSGDRKEAVQAAYQAIKLDPYALKHYVTLAFGLLPMAAPQLQWLRKRIQEIKMRIRKHVR
jgi:hypothetical protein